VKNAIHAGYSAGNGFTFADITCEDFNVDLIGGEILSFSCTEVIENSNLMAPSEQGFNDMRTDEARTAGYEKAQTLTG